MRKNSLIFTLLLSFLMGSAAWAQNRTVSGRVVDAEDQQPLPQVTVLLKGTGTPSPVPFNNPCHR